MPLAEYEGFEANFIFKQKRRRREFAELQAAIINSGPHVSKWITADDILGITPQTPRNMNLTQLLAAEKAMKAAKAKK